MSRRDAGLRPATPQPDPQGHQVLLLPWGAADEDAEDAGAAPHRVQPGHRWDGTSQGYPSPNPYLNLNPSIGFVELGLNPLKVFDCV